MDNIPHLKNGVYYGWLVLRSVLVSIIWSMFVASLCKSSYVVSAVRSADLHTATLLYEAFQHFNEPLWLNVRGSEQRERVKPLPISSSPYGNISSHCLQRVSLPNANWRRGRNCGAS